MKKLIILISVIIIFFIFFLFMYFSPRNYEKEYEVEKVKVTEKYDKEKKYYYFKLTYEEKNFEYAIKTKYTTKRALITDIKIIEEDNIICLIPESTYITTYPLCYNGADYIDFNLVDINFSDYLTNIKTVSKTYKDIDINYLNEKTFLVWNYKGFNYINKDENKEINFLTKDTYNLDLIAQVNNYLLVPDYDSSHTFRKMYVINLKNGDIKEWELDYEIYFDSYIVGVDKKSVYLFDSKNEVEYELRPDKLKMRKTKYKAIVNDEWQNISLGDFNKKIAFTRNNVYNFEVINNQLYLKYLDGTNKILLSNQTIKEIVYNEQDTVYYLVDDKLYMYNRQYGEVLLMEYFEWNFNHKNMIYIY